MQREHPRTEAACAVKHRPSAPPTPRQSCYNSEGRQDDPHADKRNEWTCRSAVDCFVLRASPAFGARARFKREVAKALYDRPGLGARRRSLPRAAGRRFRRCRRAALYTFTVDCAVSPRRCVRSHASRSNLPAENGTQRKGLGQASPECLHTNGLGFVRGAPRSSTPGRGLRAHRG